MTPKALSREELQEENEYLVDKINMLEKELFKAKLILAIATALSAVVVWIIK